MGAALACCADRHKDEDQGPLFKTDIPIPKGPSHHSRATFIDINPGKLQDFYDFGEGIGEGGFGTVRKGTKKGGGSVRAIKTMPKPAKTNVKHTMAFKREVSIMQVLDHPHVIRLYETFEDQRNCHLVMELCGGGELFDVLVAQEDCHFNEVQAAHIVEQIAKGVNYMHKCHIIHRDLKPENFLCLNKGPMEKNTIKIIDFGLSCFFDDDQRLTERVGTPIYASPEVIAANYSHLADLWSLGVITYILLSGRPPFGGSDDFSAMAKAVRGKIRFNPSNVWQSVTQDAKDLIKEGLLVLERKGRLSAAEALEHKWIKEKAPHATGVLSQGKSVLGHLKDFHTCNKFKRLALEVVANHLDDNTSHGEQMREVFEALDEDGDGLLSFDEMKAGLSKAGLPEELTAIMNDFDVGDGGAIDYTEFLSAVINEEEYEQEDMLMATFKTFDRDGDGTITKEELLYLLNRRNEGEKSETENSTTVEEIFAEVDADGDNTITFEEFKTMMCHHELR